jgi:thioredoxin 1
MENVSSDKVKELQSQGKKVLVQYSAVWCGPCKALTPRLEKIEGEHKNVVFIKVDVDQNVDSAMELGIRSVPTVMIYDGEKLVNRSQGVQADTFYKDILNTL